MRKFSIGVIRCHGEIEMGVTMMWRTYIEWKGSRFINF